MPTLGRCRAENSLGTRPPSDAQTMPAWWSHTYKAHLPRQLVTARHISRHCKQRHHPLCRLIWYSPMRMQIHARPFQDNIAPLYQVWDLRSWPTSRLRALRLTHWAKLVLLMLQKSWANTRRLSQSIARPHQKVGRADFCWLMPCRILRLTCGFRLVSFRTFQQQLSPPLRQKKASKARNVDLRSLI